ncbi:MAG: UDP-3-O-(3-hydroxymyristoyl)glucosamine N-acyltransferase, partial [Deltaproteobacteria bacterium]
MARAPIRLGEIAERLGRPIEGDAGFAVSGVAALDSAGPSDLCFVSSPRFAAQLEKSAAGAVILPPDLERGTRPAIRSPQPRLDFARAVRILHPEPVPPPGVHPSASLADGADVDPTASVGAHVALGARSRVGPRSVLYANVTVYDDVRIGADCRIHAGVVLREGTAIGDRVILQPGAAIGGDGFGYEFVEGRRLEKVPQIGRVVIEDDVEIGANTTVDRAALGETRIRRGAKIDNLVMIAHGCDIGSDATIIAQCGIAGGTKVGPNAIVMAQAGINGHIEIGAGAFVGPQAGVTEDLPPGARVGGFVPAMEYPGAARVMVA